jgi:Carboxypeptidase regulatory-like domain/TonB-dependent Receptor Plug Domain/TonB dependent receptor-like, beta-barrel
VTRSHHSSPKIARAVTAAALLVLVFSASGLTAEPPAAPIFGQVFDPQGAPVATGQQQQTSVQAGQGTTPLSGAVVDTSGAAIAGASVMVRSADGSVQKLTQSDSNGSFSISGLSAGGYQLVVSSPGFETNEMPVTIGTTAEPPPLRISLAVSAVSTTVEVQGREDSLIGIADSATQGTVGAKEIEDRPILRSGEILETVPGLIITQHAGGGKANQYFLRGFNLDHGTDFAVFLDGMPLNLPSHAHGEGYADMNTVTPEFVQRLNYEKGPYYAEVGNYSSAGSANIQFYKTFPQNFFQVELGMYDYARAVFGVSHKLGPGVLLFGGEAYYENGPWKHTDAYAKFNGLLTYSQGDATNGFSITGRAYHGKWNSSDQIPDTAVPLVGFFGALNPTDGGNSQRYSLQAEWHHQGTNSATSVTAYGFYYDLDLFSDFTYYLNDPIKGDQFEQQDRRWVAGFDAAHTIFSHWFGRKVENTFGLQLRNDWVHNGLYRTEDRVRTDKNDSNACNAEPIPECDNNPDLIAVLPAATDLNKFTDTMVSFYVENKTQWAEKIRSVLALRGDEAIYSNTNLTPPYVATELPGAPVINFAQLNSGSVSQFLPSPKASLIFGPWFNTEFYIQGGFSFHSNDVRGATQRIEPISPDYPFPTPTTPVSPLVQTKGAEIGVRTVAVPHLQSTLSLWYLHSNSELQQDGDTGATVPSASPSNRYGIEWANYYTPWKNLAFDLDFADSRALFTEVDPADAAYTNVGSGQYPVQGPGGKWVPEAVGIVLSSGVTVQNYKGFWGSLRLRAFGPRNLTSDAIYRSSSTLLVNAEVGYHINKNWSVSAQLLNLLDRYDHDIDYAYISRITPTAAAAFGDVMHPTEPFQVRFLLRYAFGSRK